MTVPILSTLAGIEDTEPAASQPFPQSIKLVCTFLDADSIHRLSAALYYNTHFHWYGETLDFSESAVDKYIGYSNSEHAGEKAPDPLANR